MGVEERSMFLIRFDEKRFRDMDNEGYQLGHKYEDYHNAAVKEFDAFVLGVSAS